MKRLTFFLLILSALFITLIPACDNKPTEPVNDNPFDIENPQTGGDPFKLTAKIAGGGITLEWTKPDFEALQSYKIYRSVTETSGYSELGTADANKTNYVDKAIENGHSYWYLVTVVNTEGKETGRTNEAAVNINTEPVLVINGGDAYTSSKEVSLTILAISAEQMMLSGSADFSGASWEDYATIKNWTLTSGAGQKTVFMKVKYDSTESEVVQASILPQEVSSFSFSITDADTINTLDVTLNIQAVYATKMKISNDSLFTGSEWEDYQASKAWHLDFSKVQDNKVKVYVKFMNDFEMETAVINDEIYLQIVSGIKINNDDTHTSTRAVTLNIFSENADEMMISNNADFSGATWESYVETKNWELPTGSGSFTVYAKFKNSSGLISDIYSDEISPQPINPSIEIAGGAEYSQTRDVQLTLSATGANLQMKLSEDSTFSGVNWQSYSSSPSFQLSTGDGVKKVFSKFKNDFEIESANVNDEIIMDTTPPTIALTITPESGITNETNFQFDPTASSDNLSPAQDLQVRYDYENDGTYDTEWTQLQITNYEFQIGGGDKTVKMQLKDGAGWQVETTKTIFVNTRPQASFTTTMDKSNYQLYHFNASVSYDYEDGENIEYRWDFDGDGSWDSAWLAQDTISYTFADYGEYNAKLETRDQNGLSEEAVVVVVVVEPLVEMIFVEGGSFTMGDTWGDGSSDELPTHSVTLNSFYMGKYEITNAEAAEIYNWALGQGKITASSSTVQNASGDTQELLDLDDTNCQISYNGSQLVVDSGKDDYPVIEISWYGSAALCNYLSEKEGYSALYDLSDWSANWNSDGYRLPTEAEWEYAAKGGLNGAYTKYSGSDNVDDVAWYSGNSGSQTHTAGTKAANELGIYDMSGNVWEWCNDWYNSAYYSSSPFNNPTGPSSGSNRVLRGGSWNFSATYVRVAYRSCVGPSSAYSGGGFRISRAF